MIPVILAVMIIMTFLICIVIDEFQIVDSFQICITSIPLFSEFVFRFIAIFVCFTVLKKKKKRKENEKKEKC